MWLTACTGEFYYSYIWLLFAKPCQIVIPCLFQWVSAVFQLGPCCTAVKEEVTYMPFFLERFDQPLGQYGKCQATTLPTPAAQDQH
jgi:hypothetical protein